VTKVEVVAIVVEIMAMIVEVLVIVVVAEIVTLGTNGNPLRSMM
jgi:hypothetical protein